MIKDTATPSGELVITLVNENGVVKESKKIKNLIVDVGRYHIASRLVDTGLPAAMEWMSVGTDSALPANGNTTLGAETGRVSIGSINDSDNTVTFSASFPAGTGTGALAEAGIFNDSAAGTMLSRTTFATVNKLSGDTMTIDWTITIS